MSNELVLVLNCGSSSLKFSVLDPESNAEALSGLAECFYLPEARIKWKLDGVKNEASLGTAAAHTEALDFLVRNILPQKPTLAKQIIAIGHRIVHGGEKLTKSTIINDDVIDRIEEAISFAPLHNPAHLVGIRQAMEQFPHLREKNVAVFDTAFHQTMPEASYLYALPYELYEDYGIRRYGAHGTSHYYVSHKAAEILDKPIGSLNIISCHLGNGSSIAAIRNGACVDTSMGLTPLEGLVMGTRCGDIDPAIIFFLHDTVQMSLEDINILLTKKSGLLGLTETSSDFRYVVDYHESREDAKRALDVFCHRLAKYIAAYSALMEGRLDAVVFTGGIGENAPLVRELSLAKLGLLGFEVDNERNLAARFGASGFINKEGTRPALVIPTNEELVIARDAARLAR